MDNKTHWYYPSTVIPCGADINALKWNENEYTHIRSEVTCEFCKLRLIFDKYICAACRGEPLSNHVCDPGL